MASLIQINQAINYISSHFRILILECELFWLAIKFILTSMNFQKYSIIINKCLLKCKRIHI